MPHSLFIVYSMLDLHLSLLCILCFCCSDTSISLCMVNKVYPLSSSNCSSWIQKYINSSVCDSEPACTIRGPWNWSSSMKFSHLDFYYLLRHERSINTKISCYQTLLCPNMIRKCGLVFAGKTNQQQSKYWPIKPWHITTFIGWNIHFIMTNCGPNFIGIVKMCQMYLFLLNIEIVCSYDSDNIAFETVSLWALGS